MAILKHIASKNADYGKTLEYLMFQHDELTQKPTLDNAGNMIMREEYYLDGINCNPSSFEAECEELNDKWKKNQNYNEIKSHHYIISFDPQDAIDRGLTGEQAQKIGVEYTEKNFPGHQALVCTHMDGHNGSGNIHVHIVINSLRKYDVEQQDFMERSCDSHAGNKHHLTKSYLIHLKQSVMDLCHRENLHQVDLLTPSERKVTEKEYWAKQRGQKNMDRHNKQILADGLTPRKTKFQTQKGYLRDSIEATAGIAKSQEEFEQILLEKYNIKLKISRGRFSYLHPERTKPITGKSLGTHYEKDWILRLLEENSKSENMKDQTATPILSAESTLPTRELLSPPNENSISILFVKSDLRLVVNLQECVKAQQSTSYANKVKLSNLKEMAKTVAYIQEHGYDTQEALENSFSEIRSHAYNSRKELKSIEDRLRQINEQLHYTGQYLANKSIYQQFCKSKNKGQFRKTHSTEISLYEAARKFLKEHSAEGKLPSMKLLKAEKTQLLQQKKEAQKTYHYYQDYKKELHTVCSNVNMILGQAHTRPIKKQKSTDIS
jgi:hypothetical protein